MKDMSYECTDKDFRIDQSIEKVVTLSVVQVLKEAEVWISSQLSTSQKN